MKLIHVFLLPFSLWCYLIPVYSIAQKSNIDSLEKLLQQKIHDTIKISALSQLAREYGRVDIQKSEQYGKQAMLLAEPKKYEKFRIKALAAMAGVEMDLGNFSKSENLFNQALVIARSLSIKKAEAGLLANLAMVYQDMNRRSDAIATHLKAAALNKSLKNENDLAKNYNNLGNVYRDQHINDTALKYYLESVHIREKLNDKPGLASSYKNIALIYDDMEQYDEAFRLHRLAIKLDTELGSKKGIATAYNNMGVSFTGRKMYDSALHYLNLALKLREELKLKSQYARTLLNIGQVYSMKKDYAASEKYLLKALPVTKEANDFGATMLSFTELSNVAAGKKNYVSAIEYCLQSLSIARKINETEAIQDGYKSLASLYYDNGDCKTAYETVFKYTELIDSAHHATRENLIAEMSKKYETEKKDKELITKNAELKVQEADGKKKAMQRNGFIVGFGLMLVLAFFIFRGYRQKQKANIIITEQKKEVEEQKEVIEEKNKDITDSINYARRIQNAILKSEEHVSTHLPAHFILFKPKDIVSGDFYWMLEKHDHLYLAVADCTGHGVPGAFLTLLGVSFLNEINADDKLFTPAEILDKLRDRIIKELGQTGKAGENKDGMDISLVRLNLKTNEVQWAGANNPFYYALDGGELKEIKADSSAGTFPQLIEVKADKQPVAYHTIMKPFTNHTFNLNKGDLFYLFTDGFADQFGGPTGKKFKYKQLQQQLIETQIFSVAEQKEKLNSVFESWRGKLEQIDDVCIIGVRL